MHRLLVMITLLSYLGGNCIGVSRVKSDLVEGKEYSALHLAVLAGDPDALDATIADFQEHGLSVNPLDYNRKTPFDYAQQYHKNNPQVQIELLSLLRNAGGVCGCEIED